MQEKVQIVVKQPSPHWVKFGLVDVRCFSAAEDTARMAAGVRRLPVPACLSIYPPSPPGLPHTIKPRSHLITITPTPTLFPVPRVRSDVVALQGTMEPNSALAQMVGIQTVAGSAARTMAFGMQGFRRFDSDDSYTVKSLKTY